jgi:hypothetical protein
VTARQRRDSRRVALTERGAQAVNCFEERLALHKLLRAQAAAGNPCAKELLAREGRS